MESVTEGLHRGAVPRRHLELVERRGDVVGGDGEDGSSECVGSASDLWPVLASGGNPHPLGEFLLGF